MFQQKFEVDDKVRYILHDVASELNTREIYTIRRILINMVQSVDISFIEEWVWLIGSESQWKASAFELYRRGVPYNFEQLDVL